MANNVSSSAPQTSMDLAKLEEEHTRKTAFYRKRMNEQPVHSALKSFNVEEAVRMSGVYEIHRENDVMYIGGNPYFSNIRDCLNAHFSGNDGLTIGSYLSGPGKKEWKHITVRWMPCNNPHEVAFYLLEEYQEKHGHLPVYNNPPSSPIPPPRPLYYSDSDSDD